MTFSEYLSAWASELANQDGDNAVEYRMRRGFMPYQRVGLAVYLHMGE